MSSRELSERTNTFRQPNESWRFFMIRFVLKDFSFALNLRRSKSVPKSSANELLCKQRLFFQSFPGIPESFLTSGGEKSAVESVSAPKRANFDNFTLCGFGGAISYKNFNTRLLRK